MLLAVQEQAAQEHAAQQQLLLQRLQGNPARKSRRQENPLQKQQLLVMTRCSLSEKCCS
jgi:hypothetical protein